MGLQKPIFNYTKIGAFYIEEFAYNQVSHFNDDKKQVLDTLSKALHFASYKHFKSALEIGPSTKYLDPNKDYFDSSIKYNIGDRGYYFSEYILEKELGVPLVEAYSLKLAIDHHSDFLGRRYDGNISWADPWMVAKGLEYIRRGERVRIMADYPLKFYFRLSRTAITVSTKSLVEFRFKALLSDGFYVSNIDYFENRNNVKERILDILDMILSNFNILFFNNVLECWWEYQPWLYQLIKENYNTKKVSLNKNWLYRRALFIPKNQRALSRRFSPKNGGIKSPILEVHNEIAHKFSDKWVIGEKLRKARIRKGLSQSQLSEASDVSERTIRNIETGSRSTTLETLQLLCNELSIDPLYVLSDLL